MREFIEFDTLPLTAVEKVVFGAGTPVVSITAAIHGEEQTAVYVARKLTAFLSDKPLKGTVQVFPVCNPAAFRFRSRTSPIDHKDLNRIFCTEGEKSHSVLLAEKIWELTSPSDYLLDLHCCGQYGSTYVMSQHAEYTHQYRLARSLGLKNVILSGGARGQLFLELNRAGKQCMLIEIKGGQPAGAVDLEEGDRVFEAVLRFLNDTGVSDFDVPAGIEPVFHGKIRRVFAERDGFFIPRVSGGTDVKAGDVIALFDGEPLTAPLDGTVLAMAFPGFLFSGDRIFTIAPYWQAEKEIS